MENALGVQVVETDPKDPIHGEVSRWAAVPRQPEPGEKWDWQLKKWVVDAEMALNAVDITHRNLNVSISIELAQAMKALEARLMLAGVAIDGQVAAEAKALKIPTAVYAQTVADKAKAAPNPELDRIKAKNAVRVKLGILDIGL
jgi:hypothetical protein